LSGYNGLYQVSNLGRVKSLKGKEKILKQNLDYYKYPYVQLWENGIGKKIKVHRLVAEAFIPNPDNKPEVNHKWGIKTDNRASELEWNTHQENCRHRDESNLRKSKTKKVIQYDKENNFIKEWDSIKEVKEITGITHISSCCRGKRKTAGGYIWRYKD
jgi:hypothetical protein